MVGNIGSGQDYRVVAVNGDCELSSGTGYGILLVRGNLKLSGNFHWNGLILVIGQGEIEWSQSGHGEISAMSSSPARGRTIGAHPMNSELFSNSEVPSR